MLRINQFTHVQIFQTAGIFYINLLLHYFHTFCFVFLNIYCSLCIKCGKDVLQLPVS
jgi:hypothetical protein